MGNYIQTYGTLTKEQVLNDENLKITFDTDNNILSIGLKENENAWAIWYIDGSTCDYFKVKTPEAFRLFKYLFEKYNLWFGDEDILEDAYLQQDKMDMSKYYWLNVTDYMLEHVKDWSEEDRERIKIHRRLWEIQ